MEASQGVVTGQRRGWGEEDVKKIKDIMRTEGLCDEADYELEETQAFGNRWAIEKFRFWWD